MALSAASPQPARTVLKTTQSGYEGFLRDELTTLPETRERMLATSITASWEYTQAPADCDAAFASLQAALCGAFFGPASGGVYSPSVQMTLYQMGAAALAAVPSVESITLTCPNIHFLPVLPAGIPLRTTCMSLPRSRTARFGPRWGAA